MDPSYENSVFGDRNVLFLLIWGQKGRWVASFNMRALGSTSGRKGKVHPSLLH
jgi:hypothetical protein